MLQLLESGRLDAVLQVAWQLTVAALCLYAPHPRAVVVAEQLGEKGQLMRLLGADGRY